MSARLLARFAVAALVSAAAAGTFWINLNEPRVVILGTPILALAALVAMDDPPGSRVRLAGTRVAAWMAGGAAVAGTVALFFPPGLEPRDVLVFAAAMSGAFAAGLAATVWYAVRLARPVRTRRIPITPRLGAYRPPELPGRSPALRRW